MADLLSVLRGAATSLSAQRAVIATAGHNIDNASNPAYARQTAIITSLAPAEQLQGAYIGRGATLDTVTQVRDRVVESQLPRALDAAASSTAQSSALASFHGLDADATGGIATSTSAFYSSLTALAQNPGDGATRTNALAAAQVLAQGFNVTAQQITATRTGLDQSVASLVGQVGSEAAAVAQLNLQISQARASGGEPNDLLDLRQGHLDALATLVGGTPVPTGNGDVNVLLPGGGALVSGGKAGALTTAADGANGGHLTVSLALPGAGKDSSGNPLVTSIAATSLGGTLGGTLKARDGALKDAADRIDELAYGLAGAINTVHRAGYGLDGSTGLDLFDAGATQAGAAAALKISADLTTPPSTTLDPRKLATASTSGASGDAGNVNDLLATAGAPIDVQSTLSDIVSTFGSSAQRAQAFAAQDGAVKDHLSSLRASASGVSIDDEMITLTQAQRGFEAISKVISTADEMLQTLLALKT